MNCTCDTSNLCMIHKPSGARLYNKDESIYLVIDVEVTEDEHLTSEWIKFHFAHRSFAAAEEEVNKLIAKFLQEEGDPYEQGEDERYLKYYENEFGHYVAIQQITLKD